MHNEIRHDVCSFRENFKSQRDQIDSHIHPLGFAHLGPTAVQILRRGWLDDVDKGDYKVKGDIHTGSSFNDEVCQTGLQVCWTFKIFESCR